MAAVRSSERSKQAYALRKEGCAFTRCVVGGRVLAMLISAGKLPDREGHSDLELERATTEFLFELAGEKNFSRVQNIMRARWHPAGNSGVPK